MGIKKELKKINELLGKVESLEDFYKKLKDIKENEKSTIFDIHQVITKEVSNPIIEPLIHHDVYVRTEIYAQQLLILLKKNINKLNSEISKLKK